MSSVNDFLAGYPRRRIEPEPEQKSLAIEALWDRVREWARATGKIYNESYGVVDVAPA